MTSARRRSPRRSPPAAARPTRTRRAGAPAGRPPARRAARCPRAADPQLDQPPDQLRSTRAFAASPTSEKEISIVTLARPDTGQSMLVDLVSTRGGCGGRGRTAGRAQDLQARASGASSPGPSRGGPTWSPTPRLVWANACRGSRKDVRDAVQAARKAFPLGQGDRLQPWPDPVPGGRDAGGRREQFVDEVARAEGLARRPPRRSTRRSTGGSGTPAGPTSWPRFVLNPWPAPTNFSVPEPTGVVGVVAPAGSSLLGLVSRLAPVIVSGNTAVVLASETRPLPAITLAEVLATSDLPSRWSTCSPGLRPSSPARWPPTWTSTPSTCGLDPALYREAELAAAENVKGRRPPRSCRPGTGCRTPRPGPLLDRRVPGGQDRRHLIGVCPPARLSGSRRVQQELTTH